ncbi:hypothetical protein LZ31DRAFT_64174 [Colletotrichum somersetense]|nr:hypothetical protein LZ31DRAFT_64174 [Colletotrichum somersetense]
MRHFPIVPQRSLRRRRQAIIALHLCRSAAIQARPCRRPVILRDLLPKITSRGPHMNLNLFNALFPKASLPLRHETSDGFRRPCRGLPSCTGSSSSSGSSALCVSMQAKAKAKLPMAFTDPP